MTADRDAGPMKAHHFEATRGDRHLRLCRRVGVEPALGLAMDLAPLNPGVLLLVGETTNGPVGWVERAGMALDVRGPEATRRAPGDAWPQAASCGLGSVRGADVVGRE